MSFEAQGRVEKLEAQNRELRRKLDELKRVETEQRELAESVRAVKVRIRQSEERFRKADEALREQGVLLSSILELIPMFVLRADARGRILYAEGVGLERLGLKRSKVVGMNIGDLFPSHASRIADAEVNETLVFELSGKDEDEPWCFENFIVRHKDGLIGVAVDVTERQQAENHKRRFLADLQEAQRLESLGTLAAGVAHDFNNLLTVVVGHLSLLDRRLKEDHKALQSIEKALQASDQATELASQMLAYSGHGRLVNEALNLNGVVSGMEKLIHAASEPGVRIEFDLAADIEDIEGDTGQIRQVVMSLVNNAMEAMRETGGQLTVRTGALEADAAYIELSNLQDRIEPGPCVFVEVEDTGCGLSPAIRSRIFDPFFSTKFPGRGLGLAAVQGIARSHHGGVSVYSELNEGSRFRVHFPLSGRPDRRMTPVPRPASNVVPVGGTVLIVDDEPLVLELGKLALEAGGFGVLSASNGQDAIDIYSRNLTNIDAVVLDLTMPLMGGEETLNGLRSINPDVMCFLMSGYSYASLGEKIKGLGIDGFIQKPFRPLAFVETVSAAMESERRFQRAGQKGAEG